MNEAAHKVNRIASELWRSIQVVAAAEFTGAPDLTRVDTSASFDRSARLFGFLSEAKAVATPAKTSPCPRFGVFQADLERGELRKFGVPVKIQEKPFRILAVLLERPGEIVTREELRERLWPADTFVEFDDGLNAAVKKLRAALNDTADRPRFIETVPKRGYRFIAPVIYEGDATPALADKAVTAPPQAAPERGVRQARLRRFAVPGSAAAAIVLVTAGAFAFFAAHRRPVLSEKDTVVLADFANSTGDPVFDGTLRQGLAVELEQSPFLSLISDQQIQKTLKLMDQPTDGRLTPQIVRDVCLRTESAVYLTGSIAPLGSQYVLGLQAVSCRTGDLLAEEQEIANGKEKILGALDRAAGKLREKLGESLSTIQKFDTPLEQATTPSLEALQAYSLGRKTQTGRNEFAASIPFYQRAVGFDPNFAIAWAALGSVYWNTGETVQGAVYGRKAYELHAPISEPERFYVDSTYYHYVLGDLDKARQVYDVWNQTYPRNSSARIRLRQLDFQEGKYEEALTQAREARRLDPAKGGLTFGILVECLIALDRLQEAATTAQQAIADGYDSSGLRFTLYRLAFLQNDAPEMARHAALVAAAPHFEGQMLEFEAKTAGYYGRLKESRELSRRALESATRTGQGERATAIEADAALREALLGRIDQVPAHANAALRIPTGREVQYATAWSLALAGDVSRAQSLADNLARSYPDDTLVRFNYLPVIRAQIALSRRDPAQAIELLQSATPYELSDAWWRILGPVYVRGEAFLMARRGAEAAAEFHKFIEHRGLTANSPTAMLAHLQLGRAYALMGDNASAKAQYREFLSLWKDADPDVPVLKQARAEYAELK